jgi:hypothetical protein
LPCATSRCKAATTQLRKSLEKQPKLLVKKLMKRLAQKSMQ